MTEENRCDKELAVKGDNVKAKIKELLGNYKDGWEVFKKADNWDDDVPRVEGAEDKDLPESWMQLSDKVISIIAHEKYGLDTYENIIEIIDADDMLNAYVSSGMPVSYDHWSHGKHLIQQEEAYSKGQMGLAYEIVINTDPAIAYCMEQNTKTMQLLVVAHASYGHNSFFKGNHMFKQFTRADEILDTLTQLRELVEDCEEKHGVEEVSKLMDSCHALESHGVNRYSKPVKRSPEEEAARRREIEEARRENFDAVMDRTMSSQTSSDDFNEAANDNKTAPAEMEENLLRYIAGNAPHLQPWQREIMKLVSDKAQYFYPQRQTQLMNEGWASTWHYNLITDLHEMDLIDDGMMMEFLKSHTSVLYQPEAIVAHPQTGEHVQNPQYSGLNPYALGYAIYADIKRICTDPTEEDYQWFPDIAGSGDWLSAQKFAMENFKDESFVEQYLSPKVMRDFHLFGIVDDDKSKYLEIGAIHDDEGYKTLRKMLASQYNLGDREPRIEVADYDYKGDRSLTLHHKQHNRMPIARGGNGIDEVLKHVYRLWGHPVKLYSVNGNGEVSNAIQIPAVPDTSRALKNNNIGGW